MLWTKILNPIVNDIALNLYKCAEILQAIARFLSYKMSMTGFVNVNLTGENIKNI